MSRMVKIVPLESKNFQVQLVQSPGYYDRSDCVAVWVPSATTHWFVRDKETMADTTVSPNFEKYKFIKKVWRRSKTEFDTHCRNMDFIDLFSNSGVKL